MLVVADTSKLNYLVLIGQIGVMPEQFGDVYVPTAVLDELRRERTPAAVRRWVSRPPTWLIPRDPNEVIDAPEIDPGERAAISLAIELRADRLLIDDADGRAVAVGRYGQRVVGTLGIIRDAALLDLLDFEAAVAALKTTSFRLDENVLRIVRESLRQSRERKP